MLVLWHQAKFNCYCAMPLINLRTNLPIIECPEALLKAFSTRLAEITGKPEAYVMTLLETDVPMTFAGSNKPCAYVEIRSIGALEPAVMSRVFCTLIQEKMGIAQDRVYISFDDVPASAWGWNGKTFG